MSIKPEEVRGEIALELDVERVSANDFLKASEAFIGLIKEITKNIGDGLPRDAWDIEVQEGSQVINVTPNEKVLNRQVADQVINSVLDGIFLLEDSADMPESYSDKAVDHIKTLSNFARRDKRDIPIRILSRNVARSVSNNTYNHAAELLSWKYEDSGTVEGVLDVVSAHKGYEFRIEEPLFGRTIKCTFSEELLSKALVAFKKRVEVDGLIRYDREGFPISVKAHSLTEFPSPDTLPSVKEMRGILRRADGDR